MALADLLRAIEADADAERARADRESAAEAAAIVERARAARRRALERGAGGRAGDGGARGRRPHARALARLRCRPRRSRSAREDAFGSLLDRHSRRARPPCAEPAAYPASSEPCSPRAAPRCPARASCASTGATLDLATPLAGGLGVDATLETWGGLELASDDGRTIRNTLEERLANADRCSSASALRRMLPTGAVRLVRSRRFRLRQHAAARPPQRRCCAAPTTSA